MTNGRHFRIIDDTDQRMVIGVSEIAAVIAYVSYFHNPTHGIMRYLIYAKIHYFK